MPKINFVEFDGTRHEVEVDSGGSVMRAAIDNLVPGIDADCGGECSCATCHVILPEAWIDAAGHPNEAEEEMLSMNPEREETSRLSCQIKITHQLDGMVVKLPEFQF